MNVARKFFSQTCEDEYELDGEAEIPSTREGRDCTWDELCKSLDTQGHVALDWLAFLQGTPTELSDDPACRSWMFKFVAKFDCAAEQTELGWRIFYTDYTEDVPARYFVQTYWGGQEPFLNLLGYMSLKKGGTLFTSVKLELTVLPSVGPKITTLNSNCVLPVKGDRYSVVLALHRDDALWVEYGCMTVTEIASKVRQGCFSLFVISPAELFFFKTWFSDINLYYRKDMSPRTCGCDVVMVGNEPVVLTSFIGAAPLCLDDKSMMKNWTPCASLAFHMSSYRPAGMTIGWEQRFAGSMQTFFSMVQSSSSELIVLDTESSERMVQSCDDWTACTYPPSAGTCLESGTDLGTLNAYFKRHPKAVYLVKGAMKESVLLSQAGIDPNFRWRDGKFSGVLDMHWVVPKDLWFPESKNRQHVALDGVVNVIMATLSIAKAKRDQASRIFTGIPIEGRCVVKQEFERPPWSACFGDVRPFLPLVPSDENKYHATLIPSRRFRVRDRFTCRIEHKGPEQPLSSRSLMNTGHSFIPKCSSPLYWSFNEVHKFFDPSCALGLDFTRSCFFEKKNETDLYWAFTNGPFKAYRFSDPFYDSSLFFLPTNHEMPVRFIVSTRTISPLNSWKLVTTPACDVYVKDRYNDDEKMRYYIAYNRFVKRGHYRYECPEEDRKELIYSYPQILPSYAKMVDKWLVLGLVEGQLVATGVHGPLQDFRWHGDGGHVEHQFQVLVSALNEKGIFIGD